MLATLCLLTGQEMRYGTNPGCGGFFLSFGVLRCPEIRTDFAPKSHGSFASHNAQFRLGLLVVIPDELPVSPKDHLHVLVAKLVGNIPGVVAVRQEGGGVGVPYLVRICGSPRQSGCRLAARRFCGSGRPSSRAGYRVG